MASKIKSSFLVLSLTFCCILLALSSLRQAERIGGPDLSDTYLGIRLKHSVANSESVEATRLGSEGKTCIITISAWSNYGFVKTLHSTVLQSNPHIKCFVWYVSDKTTTDSPEHVEMVKTIKSEAKKTFLMFTIDQVAASGLHFNFQRAAFMFDLVELATTFKPFAFYHVFNSVGASRAIFLDNDIWVSGSLLPIERELSHRSVVVTPHVIEPVPEDGKRQKDIDILYAGVFNFGFVGLSNTESAKKFIHWWGDRLCIYGFVEPQASMHFDQNWGHFIPVFFEHDDYIVIRDPAYNVAYWNLHYTGKGLHLKEGLPHLQKATGETEPVVFMHFSGMSLLEEFDLEGISRHQSRFTIQDFPSLEGIIQAYMGMLESNDALSYRAIPYGFNYFFNGIKIERWMRMLYAEMVYQDFVSRRKSSQFWPDSVSPYPITVPMSVKLVFRSDVGPDPFCVKSCPGQSGSLSFFHWILSGPTAVAVNMEGNYYFSELEYRIWKSRPDVQAVYPDPMGKHFAGFKNWFKSNALVEKFVSPSLYHEWETVELHQQSFHSDFFHKKSWDASKPGINVIGWHAGLFSIGISGAKFAEALSQVGVKVNAIHLREVPDKKYILPKLLPFNLTRSCSETVNFVVVNADMSNFVRDQIPGILWQHKYNIGYWAWELDVFPEMWKHHLAHYDEIWVPSTFVRDSLTSSFPDQRFTVKVLPIPLSLSKVDHKDTFDPTNKFHISSTDFVFLTIFDFDSFHERKNPQATIRAFMQAFPANDKKKKLIVKSMNGSPSDLRYIQSVAGGDHRVIFMTATMSPNELHALKSRADCFVSLHRSEGYGMNILEAMGLGVPTIATNYSGNVDFFAPVSSLLGRCQFAIPYRLVPLTEEWGPYKKGNMWAEPDQSFAIAAMREVVKNDCKRSFGSTSSRATLDHFGLEAIGKKALNLLSESLTRDH